MKLTTSLIDTADFSPATRFVQRIEDYPLDSPYRCIDCKSALGGTGTVFYGAGCGSGVEYRCEGCHIAHEAARVLAGRAG